MAVKHFANLRPADKMVALILEATEIVKILESNNPKTWSTLSRNANTGSLLADFTLLCFPADYNHIKQTDREREMLVHKIMTGIKKEAMSRIVRKTWAEDFPFDKIRGYLLSTKRKKQTEVINA